MAPRSRAGDRQKAAAPSLLPVFATIGVVVVAAMAVAVMSSPKEEPADTTPTDEPTAEETNAAFNNAFGDVDTSPSARSRSGRVAMQNRAPAGIAEAAAFQQGRALAAEAKELYAAALAAQKAGDETTYREKAIAARDKYDEAMFVTADWEIDLLDKYGSDDRQVAKIGKEIDTWRKQMNKIRKVN